MNTREVIGRKIVSVRQSWVKTTGGKTVAVEALILDDGTELRTYSHETATAGVGDLLVVRPIANKRATPNQGKLL